MVTPPDWISRAFCEAAFVSLITNAEAPVPALVKVGIITFMASWNEVLWPLIVIRNEELMTMPQLITLFAVGGRAESQIGVKLASATILALPIIIAYLFFQKYFIQSMASTGIKE